MTPKAEIQKLGFDLDTLYTQRYDAIRAVAKAKSQHKKIKHLHKNSSYISGEILKMETHYDNLKATRTPAHDKTELAAAGMDDEQPLLTRLWRWCLGLVS